MASKKTLELKEMSDTEVVTELQASEGDFHKMRFDHAVKGMDNPMQLRDLRRDVARLHTEVRQRELAMLTPDQLAKRSKIRARRRK